MGITNKYNYLPSDFAFRLTLLKLICLKLKYSLTNSDNKARMNIDVSKFDEEIFRTAENGKVFKLNTETGETSGLGPDIDRDNAEKAMRDASRQVDLSAKPTISDSRTQNIVNELYKGQNSKDKIGNGTMMDAIRNERKTGEPTMGRYHFKKGKDMIKQLNDSLGSGKLSVEEKRTVRAIRDDLRKALSES